MPSYVTVGQNLPLSLDVQVNVSVAQVIQALDLTVLCLVSSQSLGLLPDANRIRFYSDADSVGNDFGTTSEPYLAALAFFAQSPKPTQMAVGQAFMTPQPGMLVAAPLTAAQITALELVTDGNLKLTFAGVDYYLDGLNFSGDNTLTEIAATIQSALTAGTSPISCSVVTFAGGVQQIVIQTTGTGPTETVTFPTTTGTPGTTFVGDDLNLTLAAGGDALNGYTAASIEDELTNIANAAAASGQFVYGWCLGQSLRTPAVQEAAAAWALAQQYAFMSLVSNDANASNPSYTSDIGSQLQGTQNKRVMLQYHNNVQQYPDVSVLALMLSVDYRGKDSTIVPMFKALPGISPVPLTLTQYNALIAKGYNVYVGMGNGTIDIERTGQVPASGWWMDTVINMDNFSNDLTANIYNVFLRNGKIPYTPRGQLLLVDPCVDTGNQYTYNGSFADRQVEDDTQKSGYSTVPAVQVNPTPIYQATTAQRASRVGPPIAMVVQDAGAMQGIAVNVTLVE
jgi:hypothetical protein